MPAGPSGAADPSAAAAVHGIGDDDVRDAPVSTEVARPLRERLEDADLAGFYLARFDLPLLGVTYASARSSEVWSTVPRVAQGAELRATRRPAG